MPPARSGRIARRAFLAGACAALAAFRADAAEGVRVFAAASLTEAVEEALRRWKASGGAGGQAVFAGSSTLARQIAQGAPADLLLSANPEWADWLVHDGAAVAARDFASNRLAVAARPGFVGEPGAALAAAPPGLRLALADPDSVPAGLYARQALERLGAWEAWRGRIVSGASVRDALAWATRGEADLAVVYATDARLAPDLRSALLPAALHDPIRYRAALVAGAGPGAAAFLDYLLSEDGRALLARRGFAPPVE